MSLPAIAGLTTTQAQSVWDSSFLVDALIGGVYSDDTVGSIITSTFGPATVRVAFSIDSIPTRPNGTFYFTSNKSDLILGIGNDTRIDGDTDPDVAFIADGSIVTSEGTEYIYKVTLDSADGVMRFFATSSPYSVGDPSEHHTVRFWDGDPALYSFGQPAEAGQGTGQVESVWGDEFGFSHFNVGSDGGDDAVGAVMNSGDGGGGTEVVAPGFNDVGGALPDVDLYFTASLPVKDPQANPSGGAYLAVDGLADFTYIGTVETAVGTEHVYRLLGTEYSGTHVVYADFIGILGPWVARFWSGLPQHVVSANAAPTLIFNNVQQRT
jgi:hypothetical protein